MFRVEVQKMTEGHAMPGPWERPLGFGGPMGRGWRPGAAWMGRGGGRGRGRHRGGFDPGEFHGGAGFPPPPPFPPFPPGGPFTGRPGWPPFGGPGGGGPFRRGPRVRRGDVRAAALALLAEGPRNGYQIIQEINAR